MPRKHRKGGRLRDLRQVQCQDCHITLPAEYLGSHRLNPNIHPGNKAKYQEYMQSTNRKLELLIMSEKE